MPAGEIARSRQRRISYPAYAPRPSPGNTWRPSMPPAFATTLVPATQRRSNTLRTSANQCQRVPASPPYEGLLVPDVAIGTEQARKFVLTVNADNAVVQKYVTLAQLTSDNLRVLKDGVGPDDDYTKRRGAILYSDYAGRTGSLPVPAFYSVLPTSPGPMILLDRLRFKGSSEVIRPVSPSRRRRPPRRTSTRPPPVRRTPAASPATRRRTPASCRRPPSGPRRRPR